MKALLSLAAILLTACASPEPGPAPETESGSAHTIYLVAHGWHAGIAIRRADIPPGLWPEMRDFPNAEHIEVGWGDREFYQSRDPGLVTTLRAALVSTPSVLHVVGFRRPVEEYFRTSEIIRLRVSAAGFERLVRYIHDAHDRAEAPIAARLGPALYGEGAFYPARKSFHLFRTCNVWAARALRTAGLPMSDSITKEGLMAQAREIGEALKPSAQ